MFLLASAHSETASLLQASTSPALVAVLAFVIVAVVVADATLVVLALIPVAVASTVAWQTRAQPVEAWVLPIVAAVSLVTSTWMVRGFPKSRPTDRTPWIPVAVTACLGALLLTARIVDVLPARTIGLGSGLCAAAAAQALSMMALERVFHRPWPDGDAMLPGSPEHEHAVLQRYAHLPPSVRFWARGKLRMDPVFRLLARHAPRQGLLLDAGCGYALPAVWLSFAFPELRIRAFEPLATRFRIARHALDRRGTVTQSDDQGWRRTSDGVTYDGALCIDVLHHLTEPEAFLRSLCGRMSEDGVLLLRTSVRSDGGEARSHRVERWMVRLRGQRTVRFYAEDEVVRLLAKAGFGNVEVEREGSNRVETLFVARKR